MTSLKSLSTFFIVGLLLFLLPLFVCWFSLFVELLHLVVTTCFDWRNNVLEGVQSPSSWLLPSILPWHIQCANGRHRLWLTVSGWVKIKKLMYHIWKSSWRIKQKKWKDPNPTHVKIFKWTTFHIYLLHPLLYTCSSQKEIFLIYIRKYSLRIYLLIT